MGPGGSVFTLLSSFFRPFECVRSYFYRETWSNSPVHSVPHILTGIKVLPTVTLLPLTTDTVESLVPGSNSFSPQSSFPPPVNWICQPLRSSEFADSSPASLVFLSWSPLWILFSSLLLAVLGIFLRKGFALHLFSPYVSSSKCVLFNAYLKHVLEFLLENIFFSPLCSVWKVYCILNWTLHLFLLLCPISYHVSCRFTYTLRWA